MSFPQTLFVDEISSILNGLKSMPATAVDMPCGNGFTTIKLAENFPETQFTGIDIDPGFLKNKPKNVQFLQADIHDFVGSQAGLEFVCLVNSLYLLPRPVELLEKVFLKLKPGGGMVLIVPNIESDNFKTFQKASPATNGFIPTKEKLTKLLLAIGYEIQRDEEIVFTKIYGRWDARLLFFWRDGYLNWREKRGAKKDGRVGAYHLFWLGKG